MKALCPSVDESLNKLRQPDVKEYVIISNEGIPLKTYNMTDKRASNYVISFICRPFHGFRKKNQTTARQQCTACQ